MFREGLVEVLGREADFRVCGEAADRHQALEVIAKTNPDVAVVDLTLKDSSGLELIKDLRARQAAVAILVVSMHEESLYAERALLAGARGYLTKQQATRQLVAAIRRVAAGDIVASPQVTQTMLARIAGRGPAEVDCAAQLTDREFAVLELIGQGFSSAQIGERLHIDASTVDTYRSRLKEKLKLKDPSDLLRFAIRWVHGDGRPGSRPRRV